MLLRIRYDIVIFLGAFFALAPLSRAQFQQGDTRMRLARQALLAADSSLSDAVRRLGIARALPAAMTTDAALLHDGAPILRGRVPISRFLERQTALASFRVQWQPFRVVVSSDGTLGATFGATVIRSAPDSAATVGRYVSVWRVTADSGWRVAAHVEVGLPAGSQTTLSAAEGGPPLRALPADTDPFTRADIAFAVMARDSGAAPAFGAFAAPDGMTLAGTGELNIGPATIRERMSESRVASASWKWWPVLSLAAPSGDLGATIGEAEIAPTGSGASHVFYSKYLTLWQRQPDGSIRYIVDAGNSRPAK